MQRVFKVDKPLILEVVMETITKISKVCTKKQSKLSLWLDIEEAEEEAKEGVEAEEVISHNIEMKMVREMKFKLTNSTQMGGIESRTNSRK